MKVVQHLMLVVQQEGGTEIEAAIQEQFGTISKAPCYEKFVQQRSMQNNISQAQFFEGDSYLVLTVLVRTCRTTVAQFSRHFLALFLRRLLCKEAEIIFVFNAEINAVVNSEIFPKAQ